MPRVDFRTIKGIKLADCCFVEMEMGDIVLVFMFFEKDQ